MKLIYIEGKPAIVLDTVAEQRLITAVLGRIQKDTEDGAGYSEQSARESEQVFSKLYHDVCGGHLDIDVNKIYLKKPYLFDEELVTGE